MPLDPPRPLLSRWLLPLLALGQFVSAIDYNIVYVALPRIGAELGFAPEDLQWVVSGYALAFGGLLLLGGRAADVLGNGATYRVALWLFGAGSLLGALAPVPGLLVAGRVLQGAGGALLLPATLSIIGTAFAEGPARHRALAVWGGAGAVGLAAGSLLGGLLTEHLGWRSVFVVNVPLVAVALVAAARALPRDGARGRLADLGLPSSLAATAAITAGVLALVQGPEAGWGSAPVLVAVAVAAGLAAVLVALERRSAAPLLPTALLRHRPLLAAMGITFLFMASFGTEYYVFTVHFQDVLGYSVLQAGLAFLPAAALALVGTRSAGPVLARLGTARTLTVALLLGAAGMLAVAWAISPDRPYLALLPGIALLSVGQGLGWPAMFAAAGSGVEARQQGIASALASTTQQVGAAVGLAVLVGVATSTAGDGAASVADVAAGLRLASAGAAGFVLIGVLLSLGLARSERSLAVRQPVDAGR